MLKTGLVLCFVVMMALSITSPANASSHSSKASLWVPETMLSNQKYQGLLVLESTFNEDVEFDIVTDNEEVVNLISEMVTIPKGKHHGIFDLETKGTGSAEIFTIFKDQLYRQTIRVVESASTATQIDLILPSDLVNVLSDENRQTGYVFLLNDFNNPVPARSEVKVSLTSNGEVVLPKNSVLIQPGNHYAKFFFEANGEGDITAAAADLDPDEESISITDPDQIELKMQIAPDPIPTSGTGQIYFWLERDGSPFLAPHDVKITISIDKSANLSFNDAVRGSIVLSETTIDKDRRTSSDAKNIITIPDIQLSQDSRNELVLEAGKHFGKLEVFSSFDQASSIKITGLAESVNPRQDEETIKEFETITVSTEKSVEDIISTQTKVYALPDPAYDKLDIIVSSYSDDGPVIEKNDEDFTVFTNNKLQLDFSNTKIMTDENYAIVTARVIDTGEAKIFAEREEAESDEIEVEIKEKYVRNPDIVIVGLPIIFDVTQDLFLISQSHDKTSTDPEDGNQSNLVSITSRPSFDHEAIKENESVITVHGKISNLLEDEPEVHVTSNAETTSENLDVYNPTRQKIESMHPKIVYSKEQFPIVNHITDLNGNPIKKEKLRISSDSLLNLDSNLAFFNKTGTHNLIFYEKNTVPIESTIIVKGPKTQSDSSNNSQQIQEKSRVFTYDIVVEEGSGSGTYEEGQEVTISAPSSIDDIFIIKKKFVGWEDLSYSEPTVSFEADEDIYTRPIYQDDYSGLLLVLGSGGAIGAITVVKKKKQKTPKTEKKDMTEEEKLLEMLKD